MGATIVTRVDNEADSAEDLTDIATKHPIVIVVDAHVNTEGFSVQRPIHANTIITNNRDRGIYIGISLEVMYQPSM